MIAEPLALVTTEAESEHDMATVSLRVFMSKMNAKLHSQYSGFPQVRQNKIP